MFRNTYASASRDSRIVTRSSTAGEIDLFSNGATAFSAKSPSRAAGTPSAQCMFPSGKNIQAPLPTLAYVNEHWTTHSFPMLMEWFSSMPFFTRILGSVQENHPLALIGHVFARTYMVNRYNAPEDKRAIFAYLGKALQATQATIDHASRSKEDATMVAVWLLGNYEVSGVRHSTSTYSLT
jgi:hypothetical protein